MDNFKNLSELLEKYHRCRFKMLSLADFRYHFPNTKIPVKKCLIPLKVLSLTEVGTPTTCFCWKIILLSPECHNAAWRNARMPQFVNIHKDVCSLKDSNTNMGWDLQKQYSNHLNRTYIRIDSNLKFRGMTLVALSCGLAPSKEYSLTSSLHYFQGSNIVSFVNIRDVEIKFC